MGESALNLKHWILTLGPAHPHTLLQLVQWRDLLADHGWKFIPF